MTYDLSSILAQKQIVPFKGFWTRKMGNDAILNEVESWMDAAFSGGARTFIVCNQDTNSPGLRETWRHLDRSFTRQALITLADHSSATNRAYKTQWAFYG